MKNRPKIKNDDELTGDQIHHLLHCWMLDDQHHPFYRIHGKIQFPFRDDDHRRKIYFKHRDFLFSLAGQNMDFLFRQLPEGEKPRAYYDYET